MRERSDSTASSSSLAHAQTAPPTQGWERPRRKQVRQACSNCQKASRGCDEARPCRRCVHRGLSDTCVNLPRKQR
ncbi:MAG: hypothetical protein DHS80DRAFT_19109, partial [Piptocephalis tieghemiana]